ncbi:MAG: MCE family protein [Planctomycetales bacterium]|nr:MCE family protein [Planctomycetales bacterium]
MSTEPPTRSPTEGGTTEGGAAAHGSTGDVPRAFVRAPQEASLRRLRTRLWWLTGLCGLLAVGLVVSSFRTQGQSISVRFRDGYGLKAGDTLRYRGTDVGGVTAVTITDDLQGVEVAIQLAAGNEKLAVKGSQFWIQRARLRLGQVSGLETVLGAKYVGVIPGQPTAAPQREFIGLETPLVITDGESTEIHISFPAGEGLQVGDPVRFRGIAVGEVTYVELQAELESLSVGVRLVGAARKLARGGTQFWIERPRLDLTEIRGLETLLGGRYIAMQPTSGASELQSEFQGLAEPPPLPRRTGSLEIELDASRRLGLVRGAPITYRGLEVGRVAHVGLARDGASVKVRAVIDSEYAELVRDNSKWWAIGGIEFDASLRGVSISIESLSAWIRGGIAFATPLAPGERVVTGHRFMLEAEPQPEWLEWQPRIAVHDATRFAGQHELPQAVRVVASWKASWLGLYRRQTVESWALAVDDQTLRVPTGFLRQATAAESPVTIEIAGQSFPYDAKQTTRHGEVSSLPLPNMTRITPWPAAKIAPRESPRSVLLIANPELNEPLAVDGTRLASQSANRWSIAPGVAIAEELSGSPVVDSNSGKVIGLLSKDSQGWFIASLQ